MNLRPWTLPNFLTLTRLAALPFLIVSILQGRHGTALVIFLVASITDIVDGYLARRFAMGSPLGAYLDPIADKLFLVSTFVVFTIPSTPSTIHIPVWLLVITIFRDVFILVIALLMFLAMNVRSFPPSPLGKATTFFEIATVVAILLNNVDWMPPVVAGIGFWVVAACLAGSSAHYMWRLTKGPGKGFPLPLDVRGRFR
jgi:cardiolipin synthase